MKETQFIRDNWEKWDAFEEILEDKKGDPEQLSDLFIQITDDLSYSRTFYPNRSVRVYLNDLAQRTFLSIYRNRPGHRRNRIAYFWTDELPLLFYAARRDMLIAFLVFALAFATGVLSSAMDPEFAQLILGESYINMTKENIASGDPMAVYKQLDPFGMSLGITANNLFVAFLSFILGVFYGLGSLMVLLSNGVMVGAFQYFFIERGLFWESFLTIWIHGTLEISAIIIAGSAGLTMGRGMAFPGTFTRMQAFQVSARRGLKMMAGVAPIIILAGIFEGYLTRHTDTPDVVRGLFILVCLAFVLVYFVWYPRMRARLDKGAQSLNFDLPAGVDALLDATAIRSTGEIFADCFVVFKRHAPQLIGLSFMGAAAFSGLAFLFSGVKPADLFTYERGFFSSLGALGQYYANEKARWLPFANWAVLAVFSTFVFRLLAKEIAAKATSLKAIFRNAAEALIPTGLILLVIQIDEGYASILFLLVTPFMLLWLYVLAVENEGLVPTFIRTVRLLKGQFRRALTLLLVLVLTGALFFSLLDTILVWSYLNLVSWVVRLDSNTVAQFSVIALTVITFLFQYLIFAMIMSGFGLLYYTLREISEAGGLMARIRKIGVKHQIKGMDLER